MDKSKRCEKAEVFWSNDHFTKINENLQQFFDNQQFCDITLISSDDEYTVMAHKNVLASVSKYFLAMFGGSLSESEASEVKLTQIDGRSLKMILSFIYKGIIELTNETVEAVLVGSHVLEFNTLEKLCCSYMKNNIDDTNCLGISYFAKRHSYDELYDAAISYVYGHFVSLRDEDEFNAQSFEQLCELISNDDLRMSSEAEVYYSVMSWIDYAKDDRQKFLNQLLSYVRFPLLSPRIIGTMYGKEGGSIDISIICEALVWHAVPDMRSTIYSSEQSKVRNYKDVIVAISGCADTKNDLSVGLYYSGLKEWIYTKWPAVLYPRKNLEYTIINEKLLVTGGKEEGNFSSRVDSLNLKTLEWTEFPQLNITTIKAFVTLNGTAFALSNDSCNKIEKPFEKWTTIQPSGGSFVEPMVYDTYNDLIYYACGSYYQTYNPFENTFHRVLERKSNNRVIGVHIIRHLCSDFLVEVTATMVYVYNLETSTCVIQHENRNIHTIMRTALHDENIIIYDESRFYKYDVFKNKMYILPYLIQEHGPVEIFLTNNNNGF